jgi:hypothetical protein
VIGNAVAVGLPNTYHVPEDRTAGRNVGTRGLLIMWDWGTKEAQEILAGYSEQSLS